MRRIDAHHHLWCYTAEKYGWIDESMAALRQDFTLADLRAEMSEAKVDAAVAVQARQTVAETRWLLDLARQTGSPLCGVVGWLPIAEPEFPALFEEFRAHAALKGLRHVVQAEAVGFLDGTAFNDGIRAMAGSRLVYDLLVMAPQLEETIRFVDRHPGQAFVLDHIAKPAIATGDIAQWSKEIRELAQRPHVACKLSGMVTEANAGWTPEQLKPYFEVALETFGPQRLMVGTDWPVLTIRCGYAEWWSLVEQWIAPLSADERAEILGEVAERVYRLEL